MTRRHFLRLMTAMAGLVLSGGTLVALADQSQEPVVEHLTLPIPGLGAGMDGFRLVQLSDFHLYPFTRLDLIRRCVNLANGLAADVIVLTGDYVWREVEAIADLAPVLAGLNARHGVFAIVGNHDHWTDVDRVVAGLRAAGLPVLRNAGVTLTQGAAALYLAGLDDGWSGHPDLKAALATAPSGVPVVLLLHEPDLADHYAGHPQLVLQLSGHSHGGQVRLPGRGALLLPYLGQRYDMGLYRVGPMWLYTNRGIGCIAEPFRFNCPPEITAMTLVPADR
jgi:predicted MPP superfamily phosphohydrolase